MDPCSQQWPSVLHPSICYCRGHQPHPCYWYTSSNASHCTFNHCLQFSAVALLPHPYVCTYTHTPTISWTSGSVAQCPRDKKWGKKRQNNFRNKRLFMTHSSQTEQHSTRSASLAPEMGSTQPHQPTQLTAWGRPLEGSGPYMANWEKHSQRKCCLRLNPAGSRGGSTPSTGSPATHLA